MYPSRAYRRRHLPYCVVRCFRHGPVRPVSGRWLCRAGNRCSAYRRRRLFVRPAGIVWMTIHCFTGSMSTANGGVMGQTRVLARYGARARPGSRSFSKPDENGTPTTALLVTAVSMILVSFLPIVTPDAWTLAGFLGVFGYGLCYMFACGLLIYLRVKRPELERAFPLPACPRDSRHRHCSVCVGDRVLGYPGYRCRRGLVCGGCCLLLPGGTPFARKVSGGTGKRDGGFPSECGGAACRHRLGIGEA